MLGFEEEKKNEESEDEDFEAAFKETKISYVYQHKRINESVYRSRAETIQESWTETNPMVEKVQQEMLLKSKTK